MINHIKVAMLFVKKVAYYCKQHLLLWISYFILVMCALLFFVAFFANFAHRIPLISDAREMIPFPQKYELNGIIEIYDEGNPICVPVEISVGGFSEKVYSSEKFDLSFVSKDVRNIPLVISYKYNESEYIRVERLSFESDYSLNYEISFQAGE